MVLKTTSRLSVTFCQLKSVKTRGPGCQDCLFETLFVSYCDKSKLSLIRAFDLSPEMGLKQKVFVNNWNLIQKF